MYLPSSALALAFDTRMEVPIISTANYGAAGLNVADDPIVPARASAPDRDTMIGAALCTAKIIRVAGTQRVGASDRRH
ncbi:hypothetical protein GCM10020216_081060 [Nonomuraea helvata]